MAATFTLDLDPAETRTVRFAVQRDDDRRVWNTTLAAGAGGWEAWQDANRSQYLIAMTATGVPGERTGTIPAGVAAELRLKIRCWVDGVDGSPADTDEQVSQPVTLTYTGDDLLPAADTRAVNGTAAEPEEGLTADGIAARLAGASNVTAIGIVQGQVIEIVRGDAYDVTEDTRRNLTFTRQAGEPWPDDLTGHTIRFTANRSPANRATGSQTGQATVTFDGEIVTAVETDDAPQEVVLRPGSVDTSKFAVGVGAQGYSWDLVAIKDDKPKRLRLGVLTVRENQTPLA